MKKILTAFYSSVTPVHIIAFAVQFARQNSAAIHAVYLSESREPINSDYPFPNDLSMAEDFSEKKDISDEDNKLIEDNIKAFKKECELNGITFSFQKNFSIDELIDQTTDSDLLIIDSEGDFMQKILKNIHCPALITSTNEVPQKVILMADNSTSSKLAIEAYILLFPEYLRLTTSFVSINPQQKDEKEMKIYFKEKLQSHFPDLTFQKLDGKVKNEFENFLNQIAVPVLVVMGAFGRSSLSEFFHPSLAKTALKQKKVSLFIAHKVKS
jgi:hypothetical protein